MEADLTVCQRAMGGGGVEGMSGDDGSRPHAGDQAEAGARTFTYNPPLTLTSAQVTKLPGLNRAEAGFLVVATDTAHRHVETRLRRYAAGMGEDPAG